MKSPYCTCSLPVQSPLCARVYIQEVMLLGWVGEAITCDQVSLQVSVLWLCMYKCMQTDVQWFHDFNMGCALHAVVSH